uniref:Kunitz peptide n=1 Tax=Calliophis bivirgatus TaxID=8633 RepID=A0A898IN92_CALBG|nr:kunitz peptide [Calliophis bivirgatus]
MSSGGLLLLLGFLTLWAELTPSMARPDYCNLPPVKGPSLAYIQSFHYPPRLKECHKFIYVGCQGNANRYKTIDECKRTCAE